MAGISKVGKKGLQDGALITTAVSAPTVGAKGELFYNTAENKLYVSNGTAWTSVSNDAPSATGGTVVISTLNEGATFSYNLGTNFTDDLNTDADLTYSLESGTLPSGCTLPTTGNSAMTGTVGNVSSNTVYTFSIRATDVAGATATQDYQQQINTAAATVTGGTVTISSVNEGSSASYDVDANFTFTTGSTFSAYSLLSGSLPSGLSFNTSTGVISGTMGEVASTTAYTFTIRATDTDGDTADQAYSWTITNVFMTATGGTITTDGDYKVHKFTSSASGSSGFVPSKAGVVEYLVVAGGGGGGGTNGSSATGAGGGGAGGFRTAIGFSVTQQDYSITVGGGGGGGSAGASGGAGGNGGNSIFSTITSTGGGGGASGSAAGGVGKNGGSGGGGGYNKPNSQGSGNTPSTSPSQGNDGGYYAASPNGSTGGGGAGAVGGRNISFNYAPADGGAGLASDILATSTNVYYGGGGASATYFSSVKASGGIGGGANTGTTVGLVGGVNTGGGGSGGMRIGSSGYSGGSGGSGIVIIRYKFQ